MQRQGKPRRETVRNLLSSTAPVERATVRGWVRTVRGHKDFAFVEINDGSSLAGLQVVADAGTEAFAAAKELSTGCAVEISGPLVESPGPGQDWEMKAEEVKVVGTCPETYPLQKKRHSDEYLRSVAHLRPRTNKYGAVFRIRSSLALAIHEFFAERGFLWIHTPILTPSDCEGAGELFCTGPRGGKEGEEFFGRPAYLTVSGQLALEMFALSLGDVYAFGPAFRAEESHTRRHAAEFWMVEPEMAFCDLVENMDLAERFVKALVRVAMEANSDDLSLFSRFVDKTLPRTLRTVAEQPFARVSYTEAVDILSSAKKKFDYPVEWGLDLKTEHERFLCEQHFKKPVIVHDFPLSIKPFYMRVNDDGKTAAAMDVLVPGVGEIIGGSQREERYDVLVSRMDELSIPREDYWWYLDSRTYGSVPHAGFGLGFERLLMLVTGVSNIRDVIPFPRTPGNIEF
ncbi:MAG: asparagine--tRNA ligase [Deltaproteobacteria bacterium]|nr:asparagine--tRNA ligase [Deltaproteobacteria bacterium]